MQGMSQSSSQTKERVIAYRFHLLTLAHLPQSSEVAACAFSQKNRKLAHMLTSLGHQVFAYCSEGSDIAEYCNSDNLIQVETHKLNDIRQDYGDGDNRFFCGYDYKASGWRHDFNGPRKPSTLKFYTACTEHINKIKQPGDFLLLTQGIYQKPIADAVKLWLTCEPGIGYRGSFARFRAFESAYLQNFTYGSQNPGKCINGHYYDRIIPNYYDAANFPFQPDKSDYFFFIGRMITRKGVWTAIKATEAIGARLILAGQESDEIDVSELPDHCEFIGYVEPEQRAELMGRARGVFVPTLYMEAFGGVNVEAQLCGTPVITTNFGVFPETVVPNVTGFLCNTLQDFVDAARKVEELDPHVVREHAERYLMHNVKWEFQRWFDDLFALWESAHIPDTLGWHRLREA